MAIVFDAKLGEGTYASVPSVGMVNNLSAAANNSIIFAILGWWDTPTLRPLASVGSFTKDKEQLNTPGNQVAVSIWRLNAPSGLAISSTTTATWTGGSITGGGCWSMFSFTGVDGTVLDTSIGANGTTETVQSSGNVSASVADALYVGGYAQNGGTTVTGLPGASDVEVTDLAAATNCHLWTGYSIASSIASQAVTVTSSSAGALWAGANTVYKASAVAAAAAEGPRRMPLGL